MTDAQMLQCPDCSHRHDIDAVVGSDTFACAGCGRPLKLPAVLRSNVPIDPVQIDPVPNAATAPQPLETPMPATQVNPGRAAAASAEGTDASAGVVQVALWIRLVIWCAAVPIGLAIVFGIARSMGVVTSKELTDTFIRSGWGRFAPIARVLPFAALLIAIIVQASVAGLERRQKRQRLQGLSTTGSATADRLKTRNVG